MVATWFDASLERTVDAENPAQQFEGHYTRLPEIETPPMSQGPIGGGFEVELCSESIATTQTPITLGVTFNKA